jgi:hypothetical protein
VEPRMTAPRWLSKARAAVVAGLFAVFSYLLLLAGFVVLAIAAHILLAAALVALVGGVLCLPYLVGRMLSSSGLSWLSSLLLRNRVAEPGVTSPDEIGPIGQVQRKAPPQDTGRESAEPRGCDVPLPGPGAASTPSTSGPESFRRFES